MSLLAIYGWASEDETRRARVAPSDVHAFDESGGVAESREGRTNDAWQPHPAPMHSIRPSKIERFGTPGYIALAISIAIAWLAFRFVRGLQDVATLNRLTEPGRIAFSESRFSDAAALFRTAVKTVSKHPHSAVVIELSMAQAHVRAGELDAALAIWATIERKRTYLLGSGVRTQLATDTALVYALRGERELAATWVSSARTRIAKGIDDRLYPAAKLCLAEATLACRNGDYAETTRLLDTNLQRMRSTLTADMMRVADAVRAFAEAQAGVRGANRVATRLVGSEPVMPGEFHFLGVAWPEMQAFLDAHGLSGNTARNAE
jgi:hypothetical protein